MNSSCVSDITFYGGGGFGGVNKPSIPKTVYIPMAQNQAGQAAKKLVRSIVPRVYKGAMEPRKRKSSKRKSSKRKVKSQSKITQIKKRKVARKKKSKKFSNF